MSVPHVSARVSTLARAAGVPDTDQDGPEALLGHGLTWLTSSSFAGSVLQS